MGGGVSTSSSQWAQPTAAISATEQPELAAAYSELQKEIVTVISDVKRNTEECIQRLQSMMKHMKGVEYHDPHKGVIKVTKEGALAIKDAIKFMQLREMQKKNEPIESSFSTENSLPLSFSAEDHARDIGLTGAVSHSGSDGSRAQDRIERYSVWSTVCSECIWYGKLPTDASSGSAVSIPQLARRIVDDFIVDDGVVDRGHRRTIFDDRLCLGGVGVAVHKTFGHVVVIDFAASLADEAEVDEEEPPVTEDSASSTTGEPDAMAEHYRAVAEAKKRCEARALSGPIATPASAAATSPTGGTCGSSNSSTDTQWKSLGVCAACQENIAGGTVVTENSKANGKGKGDGKAGGTGGSTVPKKWHEKCFACFHCATSLRGKGYKEVLRAEAATVKAAAADGSPARSCADTGAGAGASPPTVVVCNDCWGASHAPVCVHCRERITAGRTGKLRGAEGEEVGVVHEKCHAAAQNAATAVQLDAPTEVSAAAAVVEVEVEVAAKKAPKGSSGGGLRAKGAARPAPKGQKSAPKGQKPAPSAVAVAAAPVKKAPARAPGGKPSMGGAMQGLNGLIDDYAGLF